SDGRRLAQREDTIGRNGSARTARDLRARGQQLASKPLADEAVEAGDERAHQPCECCWRRAMSASTMMPTISSNDVSGRQSSFSRAFVASPTSTSTSAGL